MKPEFDFKGILDEVSAGALEIKNPEIKQVDSGNPGFKAPQFFGDRRGEYPVGTVFYHDITLSQKWIDANYESINRAISILCPQDMFNQYANRYLQSPYYQAEPLKGMIRPIQDKIGCKLTAEQATFFKLFNDSLWSGITDHRPKVSDRRLFTLMEVKFAERLCQVFPELPYSIVIYQSIFVSYFEDLQMSIEQKIKSDGLTEHLNHALVAIQNFSQFKSISNSMGHMIPAVALLYARNHYLYPEDIDKLQIDPHCPPTIQDICEGVEFAFEKGLFTHKVGERTSSCPARRALIGYSNTRLPELEPEQPLESLEYKSKLDKLVWPEDRVYPLDEDVFNHRYGAMIYSIYKTIHLNPRLAADLTKLSNPQQQENLLELAPEKLARCPFSAGNQ